VYGFSPSGGKTYFTAGRDIIAEIDLNITYDRFDVGGGHRRMWIDIYKNDTEYRGKLDLTAFEGGATEEWERGHTIHTVVRLNEGDYLTFFAYQNSGGAQTLNGVSTQNTLIIKANDYY